MSDFHLSNRLVKWQKNSVPFIRKTHLSIKRKPSIPTIGKFPILTKRKIPISTVISKMALFVNIRSILSVRIEHILSSDKNKIKDKTIRLTMKAIKVMIDILIRHVIHWSSAPISYKASRNLRGTACNNLVIFHTNQMDS